MDDGQPQRNLPNSNIHHLPPKSSPPLSTLTLEDQFSQINLGSGNPTLPRTNNNVNLQPTLSAWELERLRRYFASRVVNDEVPGYHPNHFSYPPRSSPGMGVGLGSGSGLGSSLMRIPRNGFRSTATPIEDDDLEFLRRVQALQLHYANTYNSNNNIYRNPFTSPLYNYNNNHRYYHNHPVNYNTNHHVNYNVNNLMRALPRNNNRGNNKNNGGDYYHHHQFLMTWEEIKGKVISFANDKDYSKILIRKFELGQMEGIKMVVNECKEDVIQLLCNQAGSMFFQRLLDFLDHQDVLQLAKAVMGNQQQFVRICFDSQGTRAAQKLLKFMDRDSWEEKTMLLSAIRGVVVTLSKNANGYHFIYELLKAFRGVYEVIRPLLSEVVDHCIDIAMDKSGCCVIQYCIQHGDGLERDRIIRLIIDHALELAENDFGNYVVQYIIEMKTDPLIITQFSDNYITSQVIMGLEGNFVSLSKNKFGSHVVEKCLREADDDGVNKIITELIKDSNSFLDILQDDVGNFVAQTAINISKEIHACNRPSMFPILVERVLANHAFLHSHMHGKRVLSLVKSHKYRVLS